MAWIVVCSSLEARIVRSGADCAAEWCDYCCKCAHSFALLPFRFRCGSAGKLFCMFFRCTRTRSVNQLHTSAHSRKRTHTRIFIKKGTHTHARTHAPFYIFSQTHTRARHFTAETLSRTQNTKAYICTRAIDTEKKVCYLLGNSSRYISRWHTSGYGFSSYLRFCRVFVYLLFLRLCVRTRLRSCVFVVI